LLIGQTTSERQEVVRMAGLDASAEGKVGKELPEALGLARLVSLRSGTENTLQNLLRIRRGFPRLLGLEESVPTETIACVEPLDDPADCFVECRSRTRSFPSVKSLERRQK
jgi:hypothetical protein